MEGEWGITYLHTTQQAQCFSISISELTHVSKTAKAKRTTKNRTIITPAAKRSKYFRSVNTGSVWSDDTSVVGNKKSKGPCASLEDIKHVKLLYDSGLIHLDLVKIAKGLDGPDESAL